MYTYYFELRKRLVTHHQLWKIVKNTSIWKVGNFLCLQYIVHLLYFISIYITTINATLHKIPTHRRMRNHKLRVSYTLRYRFYHSLNGLLKTKLVRYLIQCQLNYLYFPSWSTYTIRQIIKFMDVNISKLIMISAMHNKNFKPCVVIEWIFVNCRKNRYVTS